jgi:hypothetical protein
MLKNLITADDGRRKFMCPKDGTWAFITEAQYQGQAPMTCPHPACGWTGTENLAAQEAEARAAATPAPTTADHF